ncbi:hypothetical protein ES707_09383 [subsurface metagenome]
MGIEDKSTYGEYYWAMQVEAAGFADEQIEAAFAPFFRGLFADMPDIAALPRGMQTFMRALAEPPSAGFGGFALGVGVEMVDETLHTLMNPIMKMMGRSINRRAKETWLTSAQVNTLFRRGKITEGLWTETIASEGYEDILGRFLYESEIPYPSIPDLVLYSRYHGDPDNPWSEIQEWFDIPARDWPVWRWLGLQRLNTLQVQSLLKRGIYSEHDFYDEIARIGWGEYDREDIKDLAYILPNPMLMVQGGLMQDIRDEDIIKHISMGDIHPDYARTYLDAVLTKPASQDIIAYELRKDPTLSYLPDRLRKIGIHPDYNPLYKELAYQIPPVADIITMAVREAFTPDIAAKFGQYEDYPPDLETWAAKKGLSKEWSQRYWAAHWNLPSPLQGFEMLHRGVIEVDELNMLLRALDVMPFWRDKLTQIAYRRLTRVDIRRMYKAGVLTVADVYESYLEHGYNPKNAKRMTDFTVQWALPKEASITRSDILTAYKSRMITRVEASELLADMGEEYFHREFMLKAVDYKKELELTENKIKGIRNLYKRRVYDQNKTADELSILDLPAEEITDLLTQWYYEVKAEVPRRWTTSQVLSFIKEGLITKERGIVELDLIGYDTEHIDIYVKSI